MIHFLTVAIFSIFVSYCWGFTGFPAKRKENQHTLLAIFFTLGLGIISFRYLPALHIVGEPYLKFLLFLAVPALTGVATKIWFNSQLTDEAQ